MTDSNALVTTAPAPTLMMIDGLTAPANFPVLLDTDQQAKLLARVQSIKPFELTLQSVVQIGFEAEASLNKVLDAFLSRIDSQDSPQLFALVEQLNERITEENLPGLADQILNGKPPLMARVLGVLRPKYVREAANKRFAELSRLSSGKSKKLSDMVSQMETQLRGEMTRLNVELQQMDAVKEEYRKHFLLFAEETVVLNSVLEKARQEFARIEPQLQQDVQRHQEAKDLLQALESRALAVEGTLTALPADQLVTRQLQSAGVATLQELATTIAGRFSRIRMTLLKIHGAQLVQGVQRLGAQGAALDANLAKTSNVLMTDVVTQAANAPGNNRLEQANQLTEVVAQTRQLMTAVEQARHDNVGKFKQARELMATARSNMLSMGKSLNPSEAVVARTY